MAILRIPHFSLLKQILYFFHGSFHQTVRANNYGNYIIFDFKGGIYRISTVGKRKHRILMYSISTCRFSKAFV